MFRKRLRSFDGNLESLEIGKDMFFECCLDKKSIKTIAYIISWNVWQMDGLKCVVPNSCRNGIVEKVATLFEEEEVLVNCQGCYQDNMHKHNGIYCQLRDWGVKDPKTGENNMKIRFVDLLK
jgi:hypothetical protein